MTKQICPVTPNTDYETTAFIFMYTITYVVTENNSLLYYYVLDSTFQLLMKLVRLFRLAELLFQPASIEVELMLEGIRNLLLLSHHTEQRAIPVHID